MVVTLLSEAGFNQTPEILNSFAVITSSAAAEHVTNTTLIFTYRIGPLSDLTLQMKTKER